jgi:signal transduction histidine kinase
MSITKKIAAALGGMIFLALILTVTVGHSRFVQRKAMTVMDAEFRRLAIAQEAGQAVGRQIKEMMDLVLGIDKDDDEYQASHRLATNAFARWRAMPMPAEDLVLVNDAAAAYAEMCERFAKMLREKKQGRRLDAENISETIEKHVEDILYSRLDALRQTAQVRLDAARGDEARLAAADARAAAVILILLFTWVFATARIIGRDIGHRLQRLRDAVVAVAAGKPHEELDVVGRDEIADVAREFESMAARLAESRTELDRRHRHMMRTEKLSAIGQLAAGIAHEINNPLGVILGFSQGMIRTLGDSAEAFPARSIEREALRCKKLVADLLIFSRQSASRLANLDLAKSVSGALSLVSPQARMHSVAIVTQFEPGCIIHGDDGPVQQIVINLCNNAVDAMPKGGTITIRTRREGEHVLLEVSDTGQGIPPEIASRIFDPFFTTKEIGKGTGLGLALVQEIVHKHSGSIELQTEPGKGTTFLIRFHPAKVVIQMTERGAN